VTYNFLAGGSRKRGGHWSRLLRKLRADVVFGQECRPPGHSPDETLRFAEDDSFLWRVAGTARWGTGLWVRSDKLAPMAVPQFDGWVVGGEIRSARWSARPIRVFSVHAPAGQHGYVRTMHEILDRIGRLGGEADLVLGGDFNVCVGYRPAVDPLHRTGRSPLLDRFRDELGLVPCWQTVHAGKRLAQTLRWVTNPKTRYHCDGIFIPRAWTSRLASCRVVRGSRWRLLSDHNPVIAELVVDSGPRG
jgi:exonuclease III